MLKGRIFLLAFLSILFGCSLSAQENRLLVLGKIISSKDSSAIPGVIVTCKDPQRVTSSDNKGRYAILIDYKAGSVLEFRILGHQSVSKTITPQLLGNAYGDTLHLDIVMQAKMFVYDTTNIVYHNGPDTVVGNWHFFIEDYLFYDSSQFLLLTFEKNLKAAKVMLVGNDQHIISTVDVPVEAINLYKDYQGYYNVMCRDSAFRIHVFPDKHLALMALPYRQFCDRMMPCIDTIGGKILFSNYNRDYPAFSYFTYQPIDTSVRQIREIVDKDLLAQYNWEFDYLLPKDRLYARKMAAYTGIDERIIAATMTGFPNSIYYTPLYAPLFVVHDTVCVFDHYSDSLFLYDKNGNQIHASKIDYHHPPNWKDWDHQMHQDEVTGEIYARFEKGGFYYLKRIDIKTGKITGTYKIVNQYAKHIRIKDGNVYYIYRPTESIQKKYLYRERIELK
ncbi:MAG TPA: hypothetical protein VFJ43_14045 [Bacteroidia bacterium]|nr:hypothetical protein [Bacteroidia bacterium]